MIIELKSVRKLRIHWPISVETMTRLGQGEPSALEADAGIARLLDTLKSSPELGGFGNYHHVFESSAGFEGFTVAEGANPTLGHVGQRTISPTFVFTSYFDAAMDEPTVQRLVQRIVDIHPWEVPVIEVSGPLSVSTSAGTSNAANILQERIAS
ncbi:MULTISPECIES: hypothetical protein [Paenarthrobacter]|uniref:hypothetical protein n=1 Tax=Paenarthrobacter TaxID=1742992 RepID=UPI0011A80A18|nr:MULTISPECIES: hypothetical protein [Paenarthrobacter]MDD7833790.1 hypothetical protein [Paenarthrobacter sp. AB444]MDP9933911.1 hypothetical protein [Paenarthrobacter nicotinovorans]